MKVTMVDNTDDYIKAMDDLTDVILNAIGLKAEGYAKLELENSPRRVDTGRLRGSITYATSRRCDDPSFPAELEDATPKPSEADEVFVGTRVEYAPYVHEGTKRMSPNRFLKNAVENHKKEYQDIVNDLVKQKFV